MFVSLLSWGWSNFEKLRLNLKAAVGSELSLSLSLTVGDYDNYGLDPLNDPFLLLLNFLKKLTIALSNLVRIF